MYPIFTLYQEILELNVSYKFVWASFGGLWENLFQIT